MDRLPLNSDEVKALLIECGVPPAFASPLSESPQKPQLHSRLVWGYLGGMIAGMLGIFAGVALFPTECSQGERPLKLMVSVFPLLFATVSIPGVVATYMPLRMSLQDQRSLFVEAFLNPKNQPFAARFARVIATRSELGDGVDDFVRKNQLAAGPIMIWASIICIAIAILCFALLPSDCVR
jgi:hypothetical protein